MLPKKKKEKNCFGILTSPLFFVFILLFWKHFVTKASLHFCHLHKIPDFLYPLWLTSRKKCSPLKRATFQHFDPKPDINASYYKKMPFPKCSQGYCANPKLSEALQISNILSNHCTPMTSHISARILKLCFPTWRWNHIPLKRKHYSVTVVSRIKEVMFSLHLCEIVKVVSLWKERGGLWHLCRLPKFSRRRTENNNLCGLCEIPCVLGTEKIY